MFVNYFHLYISIKYIEIGYLKNSSTSSYIHSERPLQIKLSNDKGLRYLASQKTCQKWENVIDYQIDKTKRLIWALG